MRIVFLGCGYLGTNLYRLLSSDFETEMWGIDSPYVSLVEHFRYVNVMNPEELAKQDLKDAVVIDTVGIVANTAKSDREEEALRELGEQYRKFMKAIKDGGAKLFVFLSSGGTVYGELGRPASERDPLNPQSLYAKSKVMEEEIIRESTVPYLILRLSNPYGGYQIAAKRQGVIPILIRRTLLKEPFEQWVSDETVRDYIYITDFAHALKLLLQKGVKNETVNVGSGIGTRLGDLISTVEQETETNINCIKKMDDTFISDNQLNIARLYELTGFVPEIGLAQGVRYEVERIKEEEKL